MKLLKWLFFKGPILVLILFGIYMAWSYFRPNDIPNLIAWWNTPKAQKVDSAGKPKITRGPYGEEPEPVSFERLVTVKLKAGEWEHVGTKDSLGYFKFSLLRVSTDTYARFYDNHGKVALTVLRKPDNNVFVVDDVTLKVLPGLHPLGLYQNILNNSPCVELGVQNEGNHTALIQLKRDFIAR